MIKRATIWLKKFWYWPTLVLVAAVFFIGTASFYYYAQRGGFDKWLSPDEAANYRFTKLYAQEGRLTFFEKYNLLADDIIHPRSYISERGTIKPVSFLGLILIYGKIASLTSYKIIPYLTPLFASLGIIFYFLLIRQIFGRKTAIISALLLASFPPFIYYTARSLFHNVLFVVCLVVSLYFSVIMAKKRKIVLADGTVSEGARLIAYLQSGLGGFFLGLAVIVRPAELVWLIPAWLILWLFNLRKIGLGLQLVFISFFLFALLPAAYWNMILYQSFWRGGYEEMNKSIINLASAANNLIGAGAFELSLVKASLMQIKNNIFHFGFLPLKSLKMLYYYFSEMFYWLFWPSILGSGWFLWRIKKWRRRHFAYFSAYTVIFFLLLFYYGSWDFHDNPDPRSHTIGNSYTRYWLPIYLGAIPLVSFFILKLTKLLKKKPLVNGARILLVAAIISVSLKFVLVGSAEGLKQSLEKFAVSRSEYYQVLSLTEGNAVIITRYHDKLLFPERKVIVGLFNDDRLIERYATLAGYLPIYYFNFTFPEKDINYLKEKKLPGFGLTIQPVSQIGQDFTLYRLEKIKTEAVKQTPL